MVQKIVREPVCCNEFQNLSIFSTSIYEPTKLLVTSGLAKLNNKNGGTQDSTTLTANIDRQTKYNARHMSLDTYVLR